jgi:hypothetical protein
MNIPKLQVQPKNYIAETTKAQRSTAPGRLTDVISKFTVIAVSIVSLALDYSQLCYISSTGSGVRS